MFLLEYINAVRHPQEDIVVVTSLLSLLSKMVIEFEPITFVGLGMMCLCAIFVAVVALCGYGRKTDTQREESSEV